MGSIGDMSVSNGMLDIGFASKMGGMFEMGGIGSMNSGIGGMMDGMSGMMSGCGNISMSPRSSGAIHPVKERITAATINSNQWRNGANEDSGEGLFTGQIDRGLSRWYAHCGREYDCIFSNFCDES